jgi:hypothetical protein
MSVDVPSYHQVELTWPFPGCGNAAKESEGMV